MEYRASKFWTLIQWPSGCDHVLGNVLEHIFRSDFADEKDWCSIIWNNKDIIIRGKPVFLQDILRFRNIFCQ